MKQLVPALFGVGAVMALTEQPYSLQAGFMHPTYILLEPDSLHWHK